MSTEYASVEALTAKRADTPSGMPEGDVPIEGVGTVRVRGLSRWEVLEGKDIDDRRAYDSWLLLTAMVRPVVSATVVEAWMRAGLPTEFTPIIDKAVELSGMDDGAERRAVTEFVEDSDAEFRDVAGGSAEADGGPTATGDAAI